MSNLRNSYNKRPYLMYLGRHYNKWNNLVLSPNPLLRKVQGNHRLQNDSGDILPMALASRLQFLPGLPQLPESGSGSHLWEGACTSSFLVDSAQTPSLTWLHILSHTKRKAHNNKITCNLDHLANPDMSQTHSSKDVYSHIFIMCPLQMLMEMQVLITIT